MRTYLFLLLAMMSTTALQATETSRYRLNNYVQRIAFNADAEYTKTFCELTGDIDGTHFIDYNPEGVAPDSLYAAPLINFAVRYGKAEAFWNLLDLGASIHLKDSEGLNVLHCSLILCRDPKRIQHLCQHVPEQLAEQDYQQRRPLDVLMECSSMIGYPNDESDTTLLNRMLDLRLILDAGAQFHGGEADLIYQFGPSSREENYWGSHLILDYIIERGAAPRKNCSMEDTQRFLKKFRQDPRYEAFRQAFDEAYEALTK